MGNEEKKRAKGVKKSTVEKNIRHQHYSDVLDQSSVMRAEMSMIRNENHQLYTVRVNKIGFSAFDDKRWILEDGVTTRAYGHWRIAVDEILNCVE